MFPRFTLPLACLHFIKGFVPAPHGNTGTANAGNSVAAQARITYTDLLGGACFETWLHVLLASGEPPHEQQNDVLRVVYERVLFEEDEVHRHIYTLQ